MQKNASPTEAATLAPYEIECAARLQTMDALLSRYNSEPQAAPPSASLRAAALQLVKSGDKTSARKILEFVFARDLQGHQLVATNFLGLAEIRIAQRDLPGAVALLKRLVLVAGDPYQNMDSSATLLEKTGHPAEAILFLEPLSMATPWEPSYRMRLANAQLAAAQDKTVAAQTLASIAALPQAPYALRVQAASALSGLPQPADFGSAELKLLAAGAHNVTPAASDHPYFYDSRLAAAQNASTARAQMEVLAKALACSPSRDDARIPFFRSAISLHEDELALASIEHLLQANLLAQVAPGNSNDEEITSANEDTASQGREEAAPLTSPTLAASEQAELAHQIALSLLRLNRLDEAASYLQLARKLEKSPAGRKQINAQLRQVRARLERRQANAARQPVLHAELEQDRLVRPRLLDPNTTAMQPATKAGEKQ